MNHPRCPQCQLTMSFLARSGDEGQAKRYSCPDCHGQYDLHGSQLALIHAGEVVPVIKRGTYHRYQNGVVRTLPRILP